MGLSDIVLKSEPQDIAKNIEAAPQGRGLHARFSAFLDEDGWRMQRMSEMNLPTWIEDPAPPLTNMKQFLKKGGGFNLEEERAETRQRAGSGREGSACEDRAGAEGMVTTLLRLAQKSGVFSEEHDHYLDLYMHALMRRSALGIARRLAAGGAIDTLDDIFFLMPRGDPQGSDQSGSVRAAADRDSGALRGRNGARRQIRR